MFSPKSLLVQRKMANGNEATARLVVVQNTDTHYTDTLTLDSRIYYVVRVLIYKCITLNASMETNFPH